MVGDATRSGGGRGGKRHARRWLGLTISCESGFELGERCRPENHAIIYRGARG